MKDIYNREWITANAVDIIDQYQPGELTLRALHYQLVGRGMINSQQHYKRVVKAMEVARWDGLVPFETFSDLKRSVVGETDDEPVVLDTAIDHAKNQIYAWMTYYNRNRWERQEYYPEVWIEKQALQNVFAPTCKDNYVALAPCSGYPSLTFLHEAAQRFDERSDKDCVILYFGDYDPSGEDIPRSIEENINRMTQCTTVTVKRYALFDWQVRQWKLPPAPTKSTDSRAASWDGFGQVELDAVNVRDLRALCQQAIDDHFDRDVFLSLIEGGRIEREQYQQALKDYVNTL